MTKANIDAAAIADKQKAKPADDGSSSPRNSTGSQSKSMHAGIAVWCDCCSCEAEPYWVAIAEEMGVDLGSDYEDADSRPPEPR